MFSFKADSQNDYMEMNFLNELTLPPIDECSYTSCYCEENVWKLCEYVKNNQNNFLPSCYAVFISNRNQSIPMWLQKTGKEEDNLAIWDYHVIFIYKPCNGEAAMVYDLDSILPFPSALDEYATMTFQFDACLKPIYRRFFRVIPADTFLNTFASDRSRMRKPDGSWIKNPPPYPCLSTPESTNNIDEFISMEASTGVGEVMNLNRFLEKFL